ncbi:hypothetical protein CVT24_003757 [Panaeolus cyanescens]|uniref:Cytochrome P450 n=1 Tax=Panaeolus cyanescens TaxID=181874 RepID=A0A409YYB0_9AGAR|nr:hypothetical protein CVT24_003757 [Panaeolus cyanescens]
METLRMSALFLSDSCGVVVISLGVKAPGLTSHGLTATPATSYGCSTSPFTDPVCYSVLSTLYPWGAISLTFVFDDGFDLDNNMLTFFNGDLISPNVGASQPFKGYCHKDPGGVYPFHLGSTDTDGACVLVSNSYCQPPMPTFSYTLPVLLGVLLLRFAAKYISKRNKVEGPYPPGPKPRFLIGNALDIPFENASKVYWKWSQEFNSSIIHLHSLGRRIVVLNALDDVVELFENRAKIYSSRPAIPTVKMIGWDHVFALFEYGDHWRAHRKVFQRAFKSNIIHKHQPLQTRKVHDFLLSLLDAPEDYEDRSKLLSIGMAVNTMYGYDPKSLDDPLIIAADRSTEFGNRVIAPGGSLANVFPLFKYVPWTWTRRTARLAKEATEEMKRIPLEALEKQMVEGTATPCLVGEFLEKKNSKDVSEYEQMVALNVANTVYSATSDTTFSATTSILYYLVTHPNVQLRAQAELDGVLGNPPRLPTFDDKDSLPYIYAIYREVLRCCPPLGITAPHETTEDDWYKGYFIPKGTMVFGNLWALNHDEKMYPEPMKFNPERFLDENGALNDLQMYSYGLGRRGCPGKHFARASLWFTIASILACFNLHKAKDQDGNDIPIDNDFAEDGFLTHKAPFRFAVTPRSDAWRALVEELRG